MDKRYVGDVAMSRRSFAGLLCLGLASTTSFSADKPLKIIVPLNAGSGADVLVRILADELRQVLGSPVIVENRPGAQGVIGTTAVANATPDGTTLVLSLAGTIATYPATAKVPAYDPVASFAHVARLVSAPFLLVAGPATSSKTVQELVAEGRADPQRLKYANGTTTTYVAAHSFVKMGGFEALSIPYKSQPPALTDLIGGQIHFMFADYGLVATHLKSGKIRALAVSSRKRFSVAPDVPSLEELGFAGFDITSWMGLSAPAHTPVTIVNQLHSAITKALAAKEVRARMEGVGVEVVPQSPEQFTAYIKEEVVAWTRRMQDAGVVPQ